MSSILCVLVSLSLLIPAVVYGDLLGVSLQQGGILITIEQESGLVPVVGGLGISNPQAMAFDDNGVLFVAGSSSDQLYTIDLKSGSGTSVGSFGDSAINGMSFDPITSELIGFDAGSDSLVIINRITANLTPYLVLPEASFDSLAINSVGEIFVATQDARLLRINRSTGQLEFRGNLGGRVGGLAFDENDRLFGVDIDNDALLEINTSGQIIDVTNLQFFSAITGIAFSTVPQRNTLTYCWSGEISPGANDPFGLIYARDFSIEVDIDQGATDIAPETEIARFEVLPEQVRLVIDGENAELVGMRFINFFDGTTDLVQLSGNFLFNNSEGIFACTLGVPSTAFSFDQSFAPPPIIGNTAIDGTTNGIDYLVEVEGNFFDTKISCRPNTFLIGDVNMDCEVNLLDVDPFIRVLESGLFQDEADVNKDGDVNLLDVAPFVALLAGS